MFTENLEAFEDTDALADEALYDGSTTLAGYFDDDYAEAQVGLVGVQGTRPVFDCWAARVATRDALPGKALVVNGNAYTIVRGEPHSTGRMRLILELDE
jgi:hypothetical protein